MPVYLSFLLYDYAREYFFFFIKRGFENNVKWKETRQQLEKELQNHKTKPQTFEYETTFGKFLCLYESTTKCYFIMLVDLQTQLEQHQQLMQQIKNCVIKIKNFQKIPPSDLSDQIKKDVNQLLDDGEKIFEEKNGLVQINMTQHNQEIKQHYRKEILNLISHKTDRDKQQQLKANRLMEILLPKQAEIEIKNIIIRRFTLFNFVRSYFFMTINKIGSKSQKWLNDRNQLEKKMIEIDKSSDNSFTIEGEDGIILGKLDKKQKIYFIIQIDSKQHINQGIQLLEILFNYFQSITNYAKLSKQDIENTYYKGVSQTIEDFEEKYKQSNNGKSVSLVFNEKNYNNSQDNFNGQIQNDISTGKMLSAIQHSEQLKRNEILSPLNTQDQQRIQQNMILKSQEQN